MYDTPGRICPGYSFTGRDYGESCIKSRPPPRVIVDILLNNEQAIRVDQEFAEGEHWRAGDAVATQNWRAPGNVELFAKALPNGAVAFVLFCPSTPTAFKFSLSGIKVNPNFCGGEPCACPAGGCRVLEIWSNSTTMVSAEQNVSYTLRPRQALLLRVETHTSAMKTDDETAGTVSATVQRGRAVRSRGGGERFEVEPMSRKSAFKFVRCVE